MTRQIPWLCASGFALLHVATVVLMLVSSGGHGEGQAFGVLLFDFPLVLLLQVVPGGGYVLYGSVTAYVWFFSIVGTLMYAGVGYVVGAILRRVVNAI